MDNIKEIMEETIESAMLEGLTLDEIFQIAETVSDNLIKKDKIAEARITLAEAFVKYVNLIVGEVPLCTEDVYDIMEESDELLFELFDRKNSKAKKSEIEVIKLTEEDFSDMLKRLGF